MNKEKILVGSPVYQKPHILKLFLQSLKDLHCKEASLDYMFIDDNADEESIQLLSAFQREGSLVHIVKGKENTNYLCDSESHHWNDHLMLKVANYKNTIIQYAIDHHYDAIFFADSDLILHPDLITHLNRQNKEIVSEIFWSKWHDSLPLEPNVWLYDEYDLVPKKLGEELSSQENEKRQNAFLAQLKISGLYEVGGLGACTLIKRSALLKGVNFSPIHNLTIHGEDRFFCIRAAVLGIELFVDTRFPAYHIYRESDLPGVSDYLKRCVDEPVMKNRITLSMVVHNEEGRFLEYVLQSLVGHIDEAVIIDDASTDNTVALCQRILKTIPLHIIQNTESMFADEVSLRKKQWAETIKTNPDWILNLDADELIEECFWEDSQSIIDNPVQEQCEFHLYDMWNETHYREDAFWNAHNTKRTFLLRYHHDVSYQWKETPQHCGRFPINCKTDSNSTQPYRIKHLGWSTKKDRTIKYNRYQQLDPGALYGIKEQYDSILDQEPRLLIW